MAATDKAEAERPVRVAVVGAGPAGFYLAEALLKREAPAFAVDLFEQLPTPFGLVRSGVAPDHQRIKAVTRTFEKTAQRGRFRFFGHIRVGRDLPVADLLSWYDQVAFTVGSSGDRRLGIPGEELTGCHPATAFVGWYNAHPDFSDFPFDLQTPRAVVVGVGNVAIDVARMLLHCGPALARTDIAAHALESLSASPIREVVVLARRGPAQVSFSHTALQELLDLPGVSVVVDATQVQVEERVLQGLTSGARRSVELLQAAAGRPPRPGDKQLRFVFLASPIEILGDSRGHVTGVRVERNRLEAVGEALKARGTGETFDLEAGIVFRSIGYFGEPVPGVPFDRVSGVFPNEDGRITQSVGGAVVPRLYAAGWIRRGPLGVIGTNRADAAAVAERMVEDAPACAQPPAADIRGLLEERGLQPTTWDGWLKLDALEVEAGQQAGKVREKIAHVEEMMDALLRGR